MDNRKIIINGNSLTIEDIFDVSFNNKEVQFPEDKNFKNKLSNSRNFLESYIEKGYPVYGVTTGFGDLKKPNNYKKL